MAVQKILTLDFETFDIWSVGGLSLTLLLEFIIYSMKYIFSPAILTILFAVNAMAYNVAPKAIPQSASDSPEQIISKLWDGIPDHGVNAYTQSALTTDFYDLVVKGFDMPGTYPGGIGQEEELYYWYLGQDSCYGDGITSIKINNSNDVRISATVSYKTCGVDSDHNIVLIHDEFHNPVTGKAVTEWRIADFDGMYSLFTEVTDTWYAYFLGGYAKRVKALGLADSKYVTEVEEWLRRYPSDIAPDYTMVEQTLLDNAEEVADVARGVVVDNDEADRYSAVKEQVAVQVDEVQRIEETKRPEPEKIFTSADEQPYFPGGQQGLMNWLASNLQYPKRSQQNDIQGRVIVKFVVNADGSIEQASVVKGVDKDLDAEALRIIRSMPKWIPGKKDGVAIRTYFTLPVTFKLSEAR